MNVESIVATAAGATVVLGALAHGARKVFQFCQALAASAKAGAASAKTAAERSAQLEPNGGSSVKDAVVRIEAHLRDQDEAIARLQASQRSRWRR